MKICMACSGTVENYERQCPNCGSHELRYDYELKETNITLRKLK